MCVELSPGVCNPNEGGLEPDKVGDAWVLGYKVLVGSSMLPTTANNSVSGVDMTGSDEKSEAL